MSRRRQTTNILNPTHSNSQDPQQLAAADMKYEHLRIPNRATSTDMTRKNPTAQCTGQTMSTVATPQFSRKITQMMVPNS